MVICQEDRKNERSSILAATEETLTIISKEEREVYWNLHLVNTRAASSKYQK